MQLLLVGKERMPIDDKLGGGTFSKNEFCRASFATVGTGPHVSDSFHARPMIIRHTIIAGTHFLLLSFHRRNAGETLLDLRILALNMTPNLDCYRVGAVPKV